MGGNTEKGKTDGKKSLRNQKMMRSKEQLEELTLQWKINHLFCPLRPWRKKAGAEKIFCSAGEDIAIREKNPFDNLPASKLSLPAKSSQSLFNGKASPKGSRCDWNQFKCEGVDASFGSLPPFFSFFFLPHPAGAQFQPPTPH